MKINIGKIDQALRFVLGTIMILSTLFDWTHGSINTVFLILGSILVITAGMRFCLIYKVLGITTCKPKNT